MEIYESESKSVRASGYEVEGNKFVILKDSCAVNDSQIQPSLSEKPGRVELRKQMISTGKMVLNNNKYVFSENIVFNSPSEAASIIWGCNLNGRKVFGINEDLPPNHKLYFEIDSKRAIEGYKQDRVLQLSNRDRKLANKRKELDDFTCQACKCCFNVDGKYAIECHHLSPIELGIRETKIEDLISLCPTCHRIVHMRNPIYSVAEVAQIRASNN